MRNLMTNLMIFATALGILASSAAAVAAGETETRQFSHAVFFKLAEPSDANRDALIAACKELLAGHEGEISFVFGTRAAEMDREVNVKDFDVSMHVVFDNRASHDKYQQHPRHLQFVKDHSSLWSGVRVFDSFLE